jgi:hypothetical protein
METLANKIPTHDPQTGELNPYYEELTGEKNPLINSDEKKTVTFDTTKLVGKEFRYKSKYGISNWSDKVKNIEYVLGIETNIELPIKPYVESQTKKELKLYGYTYKLLVRSTRADQVYDFNDCIFLID